MYISDFSFHKPKSLQEAFSLNDSCENSAFLAGGTDLLVEMKQGMRHHDHIISLNQIGELQGINEKDGELTMGALTTHSSVVKSQLLIEKYFVLTEAAAEIGSEQVRNVGTIGGNLCTGASCCDVGPALMALDAEVEIMSSESKRRILVKDLFANHKETCLTENEILSQVILKSPKEGSGAAFKKFGLRDASSISVVSACTRVTIEKDICIDCCIVIGAVGPTPIISSTAAEYIIGLPLSELTLGSEKIKEAGKMAALDALPIDDIRGSANYRRQLVDTLTKRAIVDAAKRAKQ